MKARRFKWSGSYECLTCSHIDYYDEGDIVRCYACGSPFLKMTCSTHKACSTGKKLKCCESCDGDCWLNE